MIEQKGWKYLEARVGMIPQTTIKLEAGKAEQMLRLMEKLEDNDDVQNVYENFDISDEVMEISCRGFVIGQKLSPQGRNKARMGEGNSSQGVGHRPRQSGDRRSLA